MACHDDLSAADVCKFLQIDTARLQIVLQHVLVSLPLPTTGACAMFKLTVESLLRQPVLVLQMTCPVQWSWADIRKALMPYMLQTCRTSVSGMCSCHLIWTIRHRQRMWNCSNFATCRRNRTHNSHPWSTEVKTAALKTATLVSSQTPWSFQRRLESRSKAELALDSHSIKLTEHSYIKRPYPGISPGANLSMCGWRSYANTITNPNPGLILDNGHQPTTTQNRQNYKYNAYHRHRRRRQHWCWKAGWTVCCPLCSYMWTDRCPRTRHCWRTVHFCGQTVTEGPCNFAVLFSVVIISQKPASKIQDAQDNLILFLFIYLFIWFRPQRSI